jgi:hypothetical protein
MIYYTCQAFVLYNHTKRNHCIMMRLFISAIAFSMSVGPALSFDLNDTTYIGLDKPSIQSAFSCAPSFLILGGKSRLICNEKDTGSLTFILSNNKAVSVDISPSNPPLTSKEATSLLQSQCIEAEDNNSFICNDGIQASVVDRGFAVMINLCSQGHC